MEYAWPNHYEYANTETANSKYPEPTPNLKSPREQVVGTKGMLCKPTSVGYTMIPESVWEFLPMRTVTFNFQPIEEKLVADSRPGC
jgi:hypothetical protein